MAILYIENMVLNWEEIIGDIVAVPYAYAIHNADLDTKSRHRKDHVHLIIVWNGPTTLNAVIAVCNKLSAEGKICCSTAEPIHNISHAYDYLVHDTETCIKQGKVQYPDSARITGNSFDIGSYEQLSVADKQAMLKELVGEIISGGFTNIGDFTIYAQKEFVEDNENYWEVMVTYNAMLERYCRSNYNKFKHALEKEELQALKDSKKKKK